MRVWATDLDNTLFCRCNTEDTVVASYNKNGTPRGYMLHSTERLLTDCLQKSLVVPVTTRTYGTYLRARISSDVKYALTSNGACLHCPVKWAEKEWITISRRMISGFNDYHHKMSEKFKGIGCIVKTSNEFVEELLYSSLSPIQFTVATEYAKNAPDELDVTINDKCIVITYRALSKGECLRRFSKFFCWEIYLASGDSVIDEPMFPIAVHSIGKNNAEYNLKGDKLEFCDNVVKKAYELLYA